jgi:hypothetical protein
VKKLLDDDSDEEPETKGETPNVEEAKPEPSEEEES